MGLNGRTGFDLIKVHVSQANEACLILLSSQETAPCNDYCMLGLVMITLGKSRSASAVTPRRDKGVGKAGNHSTSTGV